MDLEPVMPLADFVYVVLDLTLVFHSEGLDLVDFFSDLDLCVADLHCLDLVFDAVLDSGFGSAFHLSNKHNNV